MKNQQSQTSAVAADRPKPTSKPKSTNGQPKNTAVEVGGPKGPEPTRYGDWEVAGRCSDF